MSSDFTHVLDIAQEVVPPETGILSRTLFQDDRLKAVAFGFAAGEELSEHTAAKPAILLFLAGQADVGLGAETCSAQPGTWIHLQPNVKHSIKAKSATVMLLMLLK
ncbi:MAG: cupin domain-containing protein [Gemmataceae bacterium]